jgi:WXG100 family type VII secretion target
VTTSYMVDLEKLDESVADMATFDARVQKHLEALDRAIALLHGEWHGDAAATQMAAHTTWTAGAEEMRTALSQMRAAAKVAHENYAAAAAANQSMWKQVR